ncbi:MAG: universal stress protein [Acidobacteria bacterium]|nr:universal stress protein [Acidobacteriota bacterium]
MIPPRTILSAVDFSETSRAALIFAARLTRLCSAQLHVVHAEHPLLGAAALHAGIDLARETRDELNTFVAGAPPTAACAPQLHTANGAAVDVVLELARQLRADLIVVGGRGMSGAERLAFGSTTEGLLRRSEVSVLVVPTAWTAPRQDTSDLSGVGPVIAGVDPADFPMASMKAGCALATLLSTSLEVVHVVPHLPVLERWRAHAEAVVRERVGLARQQMDSLVQELGCSVPVELRVEVGAVPERLAETGSTRDGRAPLIVLGKKARHSPGGAPGTIAYRVLSIADAPVLMHVGP